MNENEVVKNSEEDVQDEIVTKKNPKKVEQGKRLAAISREAKERKMRQKIEEELRQNMTDFSSFSHYLIPAVASLGVFTFFYLWGLKNQKHTPHVDATPVDATPVDTTPRKKFESFAK